MDFQGVDLRSVLRTFAEISGLNMVIDPDVQGTVDIVLTDVPWDQALEVILRGNSLDYTVDGTIVRIAKIETLRREQDARTQLAQSAANAGALAVRTYTLSYAKADQAAPLVKSSVLSPRGNVQIDARTNTLIITDLPARLDTVQQLLGTIDRAEPQVEIEARIITTTRDYARALGVQWGFNGRVDSTIGNTTGLAFPNNGSLGGRLGQQGPIGTDPRAQPLDRVGTAVDLPLCPTPADQRGRAGAGIDQRRVQPRRRAVGARAHGQGPDPLHAAGHHAEQRRGRDHPGRADSRPDRGQQHRHGDLQGRRADAEGHAADHRGQHRDHADHAGELLARSTDAGRRASVDRYPARHHPRAGQRRHDHGHGRHFRQPRADDQDSRTPLLHRIPFLGWLFKRDSQTDSSRELLIFITPRIQKG